MADIFVAKPEKTILKKEKIHLVPEDHIHALSSFCQNPVNMSFENQEADEKILLVLRRHFITNFVWILITVLLITLPLLFSTFSSQISLFFFSLPGNFLLIIFVFYYLLIFMFAFINFMTWFYNITFVTNKRIVDVDFSDIVHHDVAITKLSLVEDVRYTQTGFLRSLFNYGDVFVQTAGEKENFEALAVPKPSLAVQIIGDLIGEK